MTWMWRSRSRNASACCTSAACWRRARPMKSGPIPRCNKFTWARDTDRQAERESPMNNGREQTGGAPLLVVDDIHTYYGDSYVLQGVSLHVRRGHVVAVLGRNGMGRTTL